MIFERCVEAKARQEGSELRVYTVGHKTKLDERLGSIITPYSSSGRIERIGKKYYG